MINKFYACKDVLHHSPTLECLQIMCHHSIIIEKSSKMGLILMNNRLLSNREYRSRKATLHRFCIGNDSPTCIVSKAVLSLSRMFRKIHWIFIQLHMKILKYQELVRQQRTQTQTQRKKITILVSKVRHILRCVLYNQENNFNSRNVPCKGHSQKRPYLLLSVIYHSMCGSGLSLNQMVGNKVNL